MYSLKKNENEIAKANTIRYICMQENGCYGLCDKNKADGISADNTVYLFDKDIDTIEYFDGGAMISEAVNDTETVFSILRGDID